MEIYLQSLGVGFSLFMLYITFTQFKRQELTSKDLALWVTAWVLLGILILFPKILEGIASKVSVQGPLQFLILLSIGFLLFISFLLYHTQRKLERKVNSLISAVSLKQESEKCEK